jgi:S1-C subfamily serine protease
MCLSRTQSKQTVKLRRRGIALLGERRFEGLTAHDSADCRHAVRRQISLHARRGVQALCSLHLASALALDGSGAVRVDMAEAGNPAALAGLREGDLIVGIDGQKVPSVAQRER